MTMPAQWFVRGGGKVYGPIDAAKLKQLATQGKIDDKTEVAQAHNGPWMPAGRVRGLFGPAVDQQAPAVDTASIASAPVAPASTAHPVNAAATAPARLSLSRYLPQTQTGRLVAVAVASSLVSLLVGYFTGREHLKYQIRSSVESAGKQFVQNVQKGLENAFGMDVARPEPAEPVATLSIGKTFDTPTASITVTSAKIERPILNGGFSGRPRPLEEDCLVISLTMANKDDRKQLNVSYGSQFSPGVFRLYDDVGNDISTTFFSSAGSEFAMINAHPSHKDIDPETSVSHVVAFDMPLPKTKSLTLLVDLAVIGEDGAVKFEIPIDAVEGFLQP